MTPEELEELRALAGRLSGTAYNENLAAILGAALEHIHMQEEQLANARAAKNLHARREAKLLSQVAALQKIAEDERAKRIYMGRFRSLNFEPPADRKTRIDEARRQLSEEHPEAFG